MIVIFGSINIDLLARTPRLPQPGETISALSFETLPGGKGANQAVACARLGAPTRLVGRLGGDSFAAILRRGLVEAGVDIEFLETEPQATSGIALIQVDESGENTITIVPGANGCLDQTDLRRLDTALAGARALLLQLEIPLEITLEAARLGRAQGVPVILDPAPAQPLPADLLEQVDILTPNASEAALLSGIPVRDHLSARKAAEALRSRGAATVVVKLGARGALMLSDEGEVFSPAYPVAVVDTVGAGDAFNAGLAAALSEGRPMAEALRWGSAAGGLAVTRHGAQPAMPGRAEVLRLLETND